MKQWPKKLIRKFVFDEHGGVSIYLIIITVLLFLFNAVLIDYVRILVAQAQTENAAQAAARSTLASFDAGAHRYELFGMASSVDATGTFRKVFKRNLSIQEDGYFQFVDTTMDMDATNVKTSRPLSDPLVLKHQILEAMKYRAPIEFTKLIYKRFIGLSDAMQQASAFTDTMNAIKDDVTRREDALDEVNRLLKEALAQMKSVESEVDSRSTGAVYPEVRNLNDLVRFYGRYTDSFPSGDELNCVPSLQMHCDQNEEDRKKAEDFQQNAEKLLTTVIEAVNTTRNKLNKALMKLNRAEGLNEQIKQTIDQHRNSKDQYYAAAVNKSKGKKNIPKQLNNVKKSVDNIVIGHQFFSENEKNIKSSLDKIGVKKKGGLLKQIYTFRKVVRKQIRQSNESRLKNLRYGTTRKFDPAYNAVKHAYEQFRSTRDQKNKKKAEQFKEAQRQRAKQELTQMKKKLAQAVRNAAGDQQIYNQLHKLVEKYGDADGSFDKLKMEDPEETADAAMSVVDQLFKSLGNFLEKSRNKIYVDEYILTYFTSSKPTGRPEDYLFQNREVEYILYGIPKTHANYQAALFELFAIRFALNFVESFTKPVVRAASSLPPPFNIEAILIAALAYAFGETADDLRLLKIGGAVPFLELGKFEFVDTFYKDYLRLFLFINPGGNDRLRRIMAVIENNKGTDLQQTPTYITANGKSSVQLWFIPGVEKLLGKAGILDGKVKGNRYYITKKVHYSY